MKVKDLIKKLSIYNQEMELKVENIGYTEEFKTLYIKDVGAKYNDCVFLEVKR